MTNKEFKNKKEQLNEELQSREIELQTLKTQIANLANDAEEIYSNFQDVVEGIDEKQKDGNLSYLSCIKATHQETVNYYNQIIGKDGIKEKLNLFLKEKNEADKHIKEIKKFCEQPEADENDEEIKAEENFYTYRDDITNLYNKSQNLEQTILISEKNIKTKITDLNTKIAEIEEIKKSLNAFSQLVVGNSLFKSFSDRADKADKRSESLSKTSLCCLLGGVGVLVLLLIVVILIAFSDKAEKSLNAIFYFLPFSISGFLLWASYSASKEGVVQRKIAEEYAHKSTTTQAFVGHTESFDNQEDRNKFFGIIQKAIETNAADKINHLLSSKSPFEMVSKAVNDTIKAVKSKNEEENSNS